MLLLFLVSLNLLVRYPRTPHELGLDGFVFHGMTLTLVEDGVAKWVIHPLSFLGLYPLSHPSGSIFFLASLTAVSGSPIEGAILLFDGGLILVGLLAAFMLSMEIRRDETLALLVGAFFSLSPRFVSGLLWEIPTRTLFSAFVPLFIWMLLRWHRSRDRRWLGFVSVVLVVMMSAHRLTVLMAAILIAFILTEIMLVASRTLRIRYASLVLQQPFKRTANTAVLVAFFLVSISFLTIGGILESYTAGRAGIGFGILLQLSNLTVSLARSAGFLIPLVPVGVIVVYRLRTKSFKEPFILMILLVLIPTLTLRQYTGYYIIAITAVFIGLGLWWVLGELPNRLAKGAVVSLALGIAVISATYVVNFDLQFSPFMDDNTYLHGLWIEHSTHGTVVGNDGILASKVFLVSGHPFLPVGGATTAFQSPELLIFGFVNSSSLQISQLPFGELTLESDSPFVLLGVQAEADWASILDHHLDSTPSRIRENYHPKYLLENTQLRGGYTAYGNTYPSLFIADVHSQCYKIFEIQGQSLWYVGD